MKKVLSALMVFFMTLALLPAPAHAVTEWYDVEIQGGSARFEPTSGTIMKKSNDSVSGDIVIPSEVYGVPVRAVGLFNTDSITSIIIPEGVTTINRGAFWSCDNLRSIVIPSSVTTLEGKTVEGSYHQSLDGWMGAFCNCSALESITLPGSITEIPGGDIYRSAFASCRNLRTVVLGEGTEKIGSFAFADCPNLESIIFPSTLREIGKSSFRNCTSLDNVTFNQSISKIGTLAFSGCEELHEVTFTGNAPALENNVFNGHGTGFTIYYPANSSGWSTPTWNGYIAMPYGQSSTTPQQPTTPTPAADSSMAYARTQTIDLDGKMLLLPTYALKDSNGNETNFVKLRDIAYILNGTAAKFNVGWDGAVNITPRNDYTPDGTELKTPFSGDRSYRDNAAATKINGTAVSLQAIVLTDDNGGGYTYYKLRDLGQAIGFNVGYSSTRGIFIESNKPYTDSD